MTIEEVAARIDRLERLLKVVAWGVLLQDYSKDLERSDTKGLLETLVHEGPQRALEQLQSYEDSWGGWP